MENSVLTASATYSSPVAYHFTTIGRMRVVEIYNYKADGFKTLNLGQDTEFNKKDLFTRLDI